MMTERTFGVEEAVKRAKDRVEEQFGSSRPFLSPVFSSELYLGVRDPKDNGKDLVELEGKYIGTGAEPHSATWECGGEAVTVIAVKETKYSRSIAEKKKIQYAEQLYCIAVQAEGLPIYVPIVIIRAEEKENFMMIKNLFVRVNAIRDFYKMDEAKQEAVMTRLSLSEDMKCTAAAGVSFDSKHEQMLYYALTKGTYTSDAQHMIEALFREGPASKRKAEQRLKYLLSIGTSKGLSKRNSRLKFEEILDKRFYKMDRPKQLLKDIFASVERAKSKGCRILFVGSPGVGKTSLMKAVAEALGVRFVCIPLNGLSCPHEIEGLDPGFDSADAGAIIRAYSNNGSDEMVIGLDEFDKMNRNSKEGDPMNAFLGVFLGELYDKFLQCTVRTDNTVFIATANSTEDIPETILNRFNAIVYLDDYSFEDKAEIANRYIIPGVLENFSISEKNVQFSKDAVKCIISRYCADDGARDLSHNIEKVVRRVISKGLADTPTKIRTAFVEEVLDDLVEESPALYFSRNRSAYSESVAKEIKKCIDGAKKTLSMDPDRFGTEKLKERMDYLLACRKEESTFYDSFDPNKLYKTLHEDLFGLNNVIKEVTNFFYNVYLRGSGFNTNLALCGGFGIGKTSIVSLIAEAIGYKYVKISLGGVEDVKELRGFPSTYTGSGPGRIMKGIKDAGTTRVLLQLDEIDKLKTEHATALIDLIDREFVDNFLDVSVDLSQTIIIATANEWSNVPAVLRDRFIVVNVDGYTRDEKSKIVSDYVIPKIEKSYSANGVSVTIEEDAKSYLLKTYANSFGVRDVEKALQRICLGKLVDQSGSEDEFRVNIMRSDIRNYLGEEPIPGGNFPSEGAVPGVARALAVSSGNVGSSFAIETVLLDGDEKLEMTGLPKDSAIDSVKIAVTCIRKMYPELLKGKSIHVHFGEGSVPKDGPSAGVALLMSILSAALERPIMSETPYDIAYTGEISLTGGVFAIGGTYEKLQAACDAGCKKVFIPMQNREHLDEEKLKSFPCEIIPVTHISQVVNEVFPDLSN